MTVYIAFLRGINVGGHNKLRMAELRDMLGSIGLEQVHTYIQSGNVLFVSFEEANSLRQRIEQAIDKTFSIACTVMLRTAQELESIIIDCPYTETFQHNAKSAAGLETGYVSMFAAPLEQNHIEELKTFASENERLHIDGKNVYLVLNHGIRHSKLVNQLSRFNLPYTMRNWKTMSRVNQLAQAMVN